MDIWWSRSIYNVEVVGTFLEFELLFRIALAFANIPNKSNSETYFVAHTYYNSVIKTQPMWLWEQVMRHCCMMLQFTHLSVEQSFSHRLVGGGFWNIVISILCWLDSDPFRISKAKIIHQNDSKARQSTWVKAMLTIKPKQQEKRNRNKSK